MDIRRLTSDDLPNLRKHWKEHWGAEFVVAHGGSFLVTTNDNLNALGFYQKRGFELVKINRNALAETRKLKPNLPLIGMRNIPLRDEIELEMIL